MRIHIIKDPLFYKIKKHLEKTIINLLSHILNHQHHTKDSLQVLLAKQLR